MFREHPGVARSALLWEVEKFRLIRAVPGGYLHPSVAGAAMPWMEIACRVHPAALLVRESARDLPAALRGAPVAGPIPVAAPEQLRGVRPLVFLRRSDPEERVVQAGRLRWTDPVYTAVDLLPVDGGAAACALLREAGPEGGAALLEEFRTIGAKMWRWPDRASRARLLGELQALPWSVLELVLHRLLRAHGFVGWSANRLVLVGGQRVYVDIAFGWVKVAIEADGRAHHSDRRDFESDRRRWNLLSADGWIVLRVTWEMVHSAPDVVVQQLASALSSRGAADSLY